MNTKKRYRKLILWCLGLDLIAMLCLGYRYLDRRIPDELHVEEGQESQVQKVLEHPLLTFEDSVSVSGGQLYAEMQHSRSDSVQRDQGHAVRQPIGLCQRKHRGHLHGNRRRTYH